MKKLGLREAKPLCPQVIHLRNGRSRFKASDSKYHILFLFLYLFGGGGAVMGLHGCARISVVAASRGYSLVAMCGLLIAVASLAAEHRL